MSSIRLKNDYDIVFNAVKNNGLSIVYASSELKNNINIVQEAVSQNGYAIRHIPQNLYNNSRPLRQYFAFNVLRG